MPRPLSEQVVVITGASSGIGRETALQFGKAGASVVLAARNEIALQTIAREIHAAGGKAHVIVTDVADWEQVNRLAQETITMFGQIDTWINNAGVAVYALVDNTTIEEINRLIQVNLLGEIYGVKAVLPHMKRQGYGTIINNASALGQRAVPYQAAYSASKHGVKGFTESLRVELKRDYKAIHVVLVLPSSVNTPLFNHALSKLGVKPQPISRIYEPEIAARAIVNAALHPQRDLYIGGAGWFFTILQHLAPGLIDRYMLMGNRMFKQQQSRDPDNGRTNLFTPFNEPGRVHGDFGEKARSISVFTRFFERIPRRAFVPVAAAVTGLLMYVTRR